VHGFHEADVAFLNEVQELQAAVRVLLRDRDVETQVSLDHPLLGAPRLSFTARALAIDVFDLAVREPRRLLDLLQALLRALNILFETQQRGRMLALRTDVLVDPRDVRLVLREARDEVFARHTRIAHAERHDLTLEAANLVHRLTQLADEL